MLPHPPRPGPDDLSADPDDDLPIDLLNDSFFLDGVARIMAEARARGAAPGPGRPAPLTAQLKASPGTPAAR